MENKKITYLAGSSQIIAAPREPYDEVICSFLDDLSKELRKDKVAQRYADVLSFAFWCRKGNIKKLKETFTYQEDRIGRGLAFHIAPSNVPVNFAFSLAFGMLSGNSNIIRVSTKNFEQVAIICRCMNQLLEKQEYQKLKNEIAVVSYEKDKEITDYYSTICDARIIWGGDQTIYEIRKSPIGVRTVEINFADRYSIGIIDAQAVIAMDDTERKKLCERFYNDTYLMDQNACSTPHLIIWKSNDVHAVTKAKEIFWQGVYQNASKYDLAEIKVSDKYTMLCEHAVMIEGIESVRRYENLLYVITMKKLPDQIEDLKGKFGEFFEYNISDLKELIPYLNKRVQTCVTCGVGKTELIQLVKENHLLGLDRIVQFGESLDIGIIWDGYDIISYLSRIIN